MLDDAMQHLKRRAGVSDVADFGIVFTDDVNRVTTEVSAALEHFDGRFIIRIAASHARGTSLRRTTAVSWPYSRRDSRDLDGVIADLRVIESVSSGSGLTDRRSAFGRLFDRLTARGYLGLYELTSPIEQSPAITVTAELTTQRDRVTVSLKESKPSRGMTLATFPHPAIAAIRRALETWQTLPPNP